MAVTQGLGDGYALYNGVKLPNIDKVYKAWTDKETHPYAYIIDNLKNDEYLLTLSSQEAYVDSTNSLMTGNGAMLIFKLTAGSDSYSLYKSSQAFEHSYSYSKSNYSFVWANHDILKDSTVYYSATTPIPLDGMQVIEWDGDMTGLTATDGGYAMIADFANAGSAICSITGGGETVVADDFQKDTVGDGIVWNVKVSGSDFNVVSASSVEYEISGNTVPAGIGVIIAGPVTYILAYTPAAEPETPKWQFNLQDLLSGMASAAASRGVLRRTPIAYLYNGVQLPGLPEWDVETYPYAVIAQNMDPVNNQYYAWLWCAKSPFTWIKFLSKGYFKSNPSDKGIYCRCPIDGGTEWTAFVEEDTTESGYVASGANSEGVWANHDVFDASGNVVLSASEPVPVYE